MSDQPESTPTEPTLPEPTLPEPATAPEAVAPGVLPEASTVSGNQTSNFSWGIKVSSKVGLASGRMPAGMMGMASVLKVRVMAEQALTEQRQMGVATDILMLPTEALFAALGHPVPEMDEPDGSA